MTEIEWISDRFQGRIGRLLEIGAFDPIRDSFSHHLIEKGWRACLVEPNPKCFVQLLDYYKDNPLVTLVHAAVATESGLAKFYDDGGGEESTFSIRHKEFNTRAIYSSYYVSTITPRQLIALIGGRWIDLIIIDVESTNEAVVGLMPLVNMIETGSMIVEWDTDAICVLEAVRPFYRLDKVIPPNVLLVRV